MIFISDVHDAPDALRRLVDLDEEIVILGDLVNLTDYRTGAGAVAEVLGSDFAARTSSARAEGDYRRMRSLWTEKASETDADLRRLIRAELRSQYTAAAAALEQGHGLVIHGNVDQPNVLRDSLPPGFRYVHGEVVERDGLRLGFVGGGVRTPLAADGEVGDEDMAEILGTLGPVDVLCTHVPPAVPSLRRDVITGREERGSIPIRDYLKSHQPRYHLFGDVHQPQASTWRVGRTRCVNAGYFRATGRYLRLSGGIVQGSSMG
ncbi:MAG TPA: metallophosphoesterase [Acidimicrobiia bacterium]|jgi:Icc-related predicted phosphoesterase